MGDTVNYDDPGFTVDQPVDPGFNLGDQPMLPLMPQDPGSLYTPMLPFDPNDPSLQIDPGFDAGGGGGGGSGGFDWSKLLGALGFKGMDNGGLGQIISALLPILGGVYASHNVNRASDQMQTAINNANDRITGILGGTNGLFKPYTDLGANAAAQLGQFGPHALAGQFGGLAGGFRPLGTGRGITLGNLTGH